MVVMTSNRGVLSTTVRIEKIERVIAREAADLC